MSDYRAREVAAEILRQLGGGRFRAMTGARDFGYQATPDGPELRFRMPCRVNGRRANVCRIRLDASDTYTLTLAHASAAGYTVLAEESEIYCDTLCARLEALSGLRLSL